MSAMLIFLGVFLSVYGLANWYIWRHLAKVLPLLGHLRYPLLVLFWFLVFSFPIGRIGGAFCRCAATDHLALIGSWWLGFMAMAVLALAVCDAVILTDRFFRVLPSIFRLRPDRAKLTCFWVLAALLTLTMLAGHWNALHPVVREFEITLPRGSGSESHMRIVVVSDIHAGILVNNSWLARIVDLINEQEAQAVLLVGDIVDADVSKAMEQNLASELSRLDPPLGVYAVTGNHEYYAGANEIAGYLESGGVTVLRDEAAVPGSAIWLVGRRDMQAVRFGIEEVSLAELVASNPGLPVIVMDHTPKRLEESARAGVDMQVSGHTHNGQLWPFNYVTGLIFEQDHGFLRIDDTMFYVSCGVGTWGPPVRTSSRPEIVVFDIGFE